MKINDGRLKNIYEEIYVEQLETSLKIEIFDINIVFLMISLLLWLNLKVACKNYVEILNQILLFSNLENLRNRWQSLVPRYQIFELKHFLSYFYRSLCISLNSRYFSCISSSEYSLSFLITVGTFCGGNNSLVSLGSILFGDDCLWW